MSTERRLLLALGLSFLLIIFYPYILKTFFPSTVPEPKVQAPVVSGQSTTATAQDPAREALRSAGAPSGQTGFSFTDVPIFNKKVERVTVNGYDLGISAVGGLVQSLNLVEFVGKKADSETLIKATNGPGAFQVWLEGFEPFSSTNVFNKENTGNPNELVYTSTLDDKIQMTKTYRFTPGQHGFELLLSFSNLTEKPIYTRYDMSNQLFFNESGYNANFTEFNLQTPEKLHSKKVRKIKKNSFTYEGMIDWIGLSRKYLSLFLQPSKDVVLASVKAKQVSETQIESILTTDRFEIPVGGKAVHNYFIYAGPNNYQELKSFGFGFQKIISKGFFGPLRIAILVSLHWFYGLWPNYGIAIILLTLIIKLLFTPLTHMSFVSMRKMQALQPKIKALQASLKETPQKLQKEMMMLYKKNKVNPLGGCFPMLLQMPIFIALYQALSQAVELRGAPFYWWITDLSEPDKLFTLPFTIPMLGDGFNVLPLIMIGSMIWQQKLNPSSGMSPEQEKMMMFMPIIFGVIFYSLPSGLVLYWTVSNFLTILHQGWIKKIHIELPHHD